MSKPSEIAPAKLIDDELKQILDNTPIVFGLKNQGHIPTIERMLDEAWERIGKEIGWCPKTARKHYERRDITTKAEAAAKEIHRYATGEYLLDESDDEAIAEITAIITRTFTQEARP